MTAAVYQLPGAAAPPSEATGLNLSPAQVQEAAGGYVQPARQLRELHARGFARAYISRLTGRVVLERAHYEAVVRGQFGQGAPAAGTAKAPPQPDADGLRKFFREKRKK